MDKFSVIEETNDYIISHGSGLTWAEANLVVVNKMRDDSETVESDSINDVIFFNLECNYPGLGVSYICDGRKITYYILEDPGRRIFDGED